MDADATRSQLVAALVRVAGGDRAALRLVYQDTSAKLFGVCLRILKDRGEAEDVLQDVYVTVWRKAGSFDPARASPITWLVAIARNRAIDRLRSSAASRRSEPIETAEDGRDDAPTALDLGVAASQRERLNTCLGGLGDEVKPVPPPDGAWSGIEAAIAGPAPSAALAFGSLWQNLFFWRIIGIGSSALATACLVAIAYLGSSAAPDRAPLLATLGR